jgi:4-amino-4-deoxy-L-arabinose transferase-like glycosyltransferase
VTASRQNRLILLALWLVFYCSVTLFAPPLLDDADSVHAEVAREMLTRHDFVTLYANNIRYLEKAPLYYWSMAAAMRVLGPTTAASRLPLAFSVLALALLLESLARRAFLSHRAGLYAGLITLSSFGIFIFSRINIPDVLVCVFLTLSLYAYHRTESEPEPSQNWCWLFALGIALNLLTKGLIGIVFPIGIVALHLLATRGLRGTLRRLRQFHPLSSTAILLAIAIPWHVLIALANPGHGHPGALSHASGHWQVPLPTDGNVHGWAWFYFLNEQLYRYLNLRVPHDYDTSPIWLFYGLIFLWLAPWSAFLPTAIARALSTIRVPHPFQSHRKGWRALRELPANLPSDLRLLDPPSRTNLFLLLWAAVPLLFFSLSTRQEYYVLPALPPLILLLAATLAESSHPVLAAFTARTMARVSTALLLAGSLAATAALFFVLTAGPARPGTDLATLLHQNPADYALSFGHFLDLTGPAMALFRLPLLLTAAACFLGTLAHFFLRRASLPHAATLTLAAASFVFLAAAWLGLRTFSPTLTSAQLADAIRPQLQPLGSSNPDLIAIHGEYEAGSTLGFYLRRNDLHIIEGRSSNLWYGSFFPDAPLIFETPEAIAKKWPGPQRIFLWQDPHDPDRKPLDLPAPVYVIANSGGHQILSNQPNR